ncbi:deoxyribose-phosphate aldolase [Chryseobacterium sp. MFBS3-17]|uniref:deoxyribose-phosphate aldolase n=1 Tax=Chryseobacterium sp. MFBS3-17 TaxID=2886689 RepID=UPI001D0E26BE|nr:deoxyribose-phosphate aldolase [Chryseobacterium sp. MFBS3-17]MCC2591124.1 deoxyribose-phosphate aldolase [Chryseobacterium sp. MFBS3-17]
MNINLYLDSTYLKTPAQSGLSEAETLNVVLQLTDEAIAHHIFAVMIRPDYVKQVKDYLATKNTDVKVGTVIGFHEGTNATGTKLQEAEKAIAAGADELDFVLNYEAFKNRQMDLVKDEVISCTRLCLKHGKIAKWIIEIAALTDEEISEITRNISHWITTEFPGQEEMVFVKSSTGFYQTEGGKPNGATFEGIAIMLQNSGKLPVKAAGGVRTPEDAEKMIQLGVKRIGTSSAVALLRNEESGGGY